MPYQRSVIYYPERDPVFQTYARNVQLNFDLDTLVFDCFPSSIEVKFLEDSSWLIA